MIKHHRILLLASAYAVGGALFTAVAATPRPAATAPTTQKSKTEFTPAFGAIAYYDESCRRCHGPQGSFYGTELGKGLNDAQLKKIVDDMANGPGQSPLTAGQLEIETAFHRALVLGTPYLSVTEWAADKIAGEVMPEAKVTIAIAASGGGDPKSVEATVDDHSWSAKLPAGVKASDVIVTAELKGKKTILPLAKSPFSHTNPIPATQPAK